MTNRWSSVRLIQFAKPGEMFKKYIPETDESDPNARKLLDAATAVGSTKSGVAKGSYKSERSQRLSTSPPKTSRRLSKAVRAQAKEGTPINVGKRFSPQLEKMMRAEVLVDPFQVHGEFNKTRNELLAKHAAELKAHFKGAPKHVVDAAKDAHRAQLAALEEPYFAKIRSSNKGPSETYGGYLKRLRATVRSNAAERLSGRRQVLQAVRKHVSESLPSPLPESVMAGIAKGTGHKEAVVGAYKRTVKSGIASEHGKGTSFKPIPFKLGGKEEPDLLAILKSGEEKLKGASNKEIDRRINIRDQMHTALYKKSRVAIEGLRKKERMAPYPHKELDRQANMAIHNAIYSPVAPEGMEGSYEHLRGMHKIMSKKEILAGRLGLKKPEHIDKIRARASSLLIPDQKQYSNIQRNILREGAIFRPPAAPPPYAGQKLVKSVGKIARSLLLKKETRFSANDNEASRLRRQLAAAKQKAEDKSPLHDIATGSIEGGLGVLATDKLIRKFAPEGSKIGRKLAIGAGVGGIATGTIGYGLNRLLRNKQPNQQYSNPSRPIHFDEGSSTLYPPKKKSRLSVAQDRYRKQIHGSEIQRKENNLVRSAITGAALGGALRKTKVGAITGAAVGTATETGLLLRGRKNKDVFGDSPYRDKQIQKLPWQTAGLASLAVTAHHLYKKHFSSRVSLIQFAMTPEERDAKRKQRRWEEDRLPRRAEEFYTRAGRAGRLLRDITQNGNGTSKDERGREREPEWKKPWVKKAVGVGLLVTAFKGRNLLKHAAETPVGQAIRSKVSAATAKVGKAFPFTTKAKESATGFYHGAKSEYEDIKSQFKQRTPQEKFKVAQKEKAATTEAEQKRKDFLKEALEKGKPLQWQSRTKLIKFAETVPDWDIRDARGRSARVFAPGSQIRTRRQKKWHEKKANRDLIAAGLITAAGAGGLGTKVYYDARRAAAQGAADVSTRVVKPSSFDPLIAAYHKWHPSIKKLSSLFDRLIEFKSPPEDKNKHRWGAVAGGIGGGTTGALTGAYVGSLHPDTMGAYMKEVNKGVIDSINDSMDSFGTHIGEGWKGGTQKDKPFGRGKFDGVERKARLAAINDRIAKRAALKRIGKSAGIGAAALGSIGALAGYAQSRSGNKPSSR